jgi:hypothetical protein
MKFDDRSLEILNCLVSGWQRGDAPLSGGISYQEVFDWLEAIGADPPVELMARLDELQKLSAEYQKRNK